MHKVYLMKTDKFVKIGITSGEITKRIKQVQTGCPLDIYFVRHWRVKSRALALAIEKDIHIKLSNRNTHGEWFKNVNDNSKTIQCTFIEHGVDYASFVDTKLGKQMSMSNTSTDIKNSILKAYHQKDINRFLNISKRIEIMPEKAVYNKISNFYSLYLHRLNEEIK